MAGSVRVVLSSVWDDKGIKEAQRSIKGISDKVDGAFRAIGVAVAAAGVAVGAFAKSAIDAASDLQESTNAVNVAFGDAAEGVLAIGKNSAESFGLAQNEFNAAAVRFSAFAERIVGEGGDVAGFIQDVTGRAADFASVFNIEVSEALQVFQSGLAGEAEPLKRFGINLLESEVKAYALRTGLIAVGETMTEQQKVQARYGLLMESTAKTAGDFANTSDGLANSQRILRATFTDLQATIGTALLPVVTELLNQVANYLLPKFEELGAWLNSPEGSKAVADLGVAFSKAFDAVFEFIDFLIRNIEVIKNVGLAVLGVLTAIKLYTIGVQAAAAAHAIFNSTLLVSPWGLAAVGLAGIATGMWLVYDAAKDTAPAVQAVNEEILKNENAFVTAATNGSSAYKGLIPTLEYTGESLDKVKVAVEAGNAELTRMNGLKLTALRAELKAAADEAVRLFAATTFTGTGGTADWLNKMFGTGPGGTAGTPSGFWDTDTSGGGGGGATGPTRREQAQTAFENAQKQMQTALANYNKAVASARKTYDKAINDANERYAKAVEGAIQARDKGLAAAEKAHNENITRIQRDFAKRQADIITTSINRLRDAYRQATQTNVADLFETEEVGKSVGNLINALRDRLRSSQALVQRSGELAAAGFSQTFIEQIVGAGTDTGNELAQAILDSTPEAQAELKALFDAMEVQSSRGMDSLARTLYEKAGLATQELRDLYETNNIELQEALKQAQLDYRDAQVAVLKSFDEAMTAAAQTRQEAYKDAHQNLTDALAAAAEVLNEELDKIQKEFEDKLDELGFGLRNLRNELQAFIDAARGAIVTPPPMKAPPASPIRDFKPIRSGPATTINVNVKTDATQSTAQVGKKIASTISRYTSVGGTLRTGIDG